MLSGLDLSVWSVLITEQLCCDRTAVWVHANDLSFEVL